MTGQVKENFDKSVQLFLYSTQRNKYLLRAKDLSRYPQGLRQIVLPL